MESIETQIKELVAGILSVPVDVIEDDTAIGDIPEWDSLRHIQIVTAIEEKFGFRFTPDVMMDLEDIGDIVAATKARADR